MLSFKDGIVKGPEVQEHHFNFVRFTRLHNVGVLCYNMVLKSVSLVQITVTDEEVSNPSFLDLVRTPQMRKCTLILMFAW